LGLLRADESFAAEVLRAQGLRLSVVRREVDRLSRASRACQAPSVGGTTPESSQSSPSSPALGAPSSEPTPADGGERGKPAAMLRKSMTTDDTTARRREKAIKWVSAHPDRIIFPGICPCCRGGAKSSIRIGARKGGGGTGLHLVQYESINVPYCYKCRDHWPRKPTKIEIGIFWLLVIVASGEFAGSNTLWGWAFAVAAVAAFAVPASVDLRRVEKLKKPSCVSQGCAVKMRVPSTFRFASHSYAEAFIKANHLG